LFFAAAHRSFSISEKRLHILSYLSKALTSGDYPRKGDCTSMIRRTSLCRSSMSPFRASGPQGLVSAAHLEISTRSPRRNADYTKAHESPCWDNVGTKLTRTIVEGIPSSEVWHDVTDEIHHLPQIRYIPCVDKSMDLWVGLRQRQVVLALTFRVCRRREYTPGHPPPIGDDPASYPAHRTSTSCVSVITDVR